MQPGLLENVVFLIEWKTILTYEHYVRVHKVFYIIINAGQTMFTIRAKTLR